MSKVTYNQITTVKKEIEVPDGAMSVEFNDNIESAIFMTLLSLEHFSYDKLLDQLYSEDATSVTYAAGIFSSFWDKALQLKQTVMAYI